VNHPLLLVFLTAAGLYAAKLWRDDLRASRRGAPPSGALPGATPAPARALVFGLAGSLVLVALETVGEFHLGLAAEQSRLTWLAALYSLAAAPVVEEIIFRGYIVVENRGRVALWAGVAAASLGFALLHPFLWQWDEGGFRLTLTPKGIFSSAFAFVASLWFYTVRFNPWNPHRSLLPCFAAHAAKNGAVIAVKAATGYMGGLW
jgi:membrane protease YdiL (CAAX protease family)